MKRRDYLKSSGCVLGLSISGCLSKKPSERTQENIKISNISTDEVNSENIEINVKNIPVSQDRPPKIDIIFSNYKNRETVISGTEGSVFGGQRSNNSKLILLRENEWDKSEIYENCFKLKNKQPLMSSEFDTIVDPNKSKNQVYDILRSSQGNKCLVSGEYRFETYYELIEDKIGEDSIQDNFNWGFNITLE